MECVFMPILVVAFIVSSVLWTALSLWLSARQTSCVRRHRDSGPADFAAIASVEDHRKAADYTVANERLANVRALIDFAVSLAWILGGYNLLYGALASVIAPSIGRGVAF